MVSNKEHPLLRRCDRPTGNFRLLPFVVFDHWYLNGDISHVPPVEYDEVDHAENPVSSIAHTTFETLRKSRGYSDPEHVEFFPIRRASLLLVTFVRVQSIDGPTDGSKYYWKIVARP